MGKRILMSALAIAATLALAPNAGAQAPDEALVKKGRGLFAARGCSACHTMGKKLAGPDLSGVTVRRSREWLGRFLTETENMLATDSIAMGLVKEFNGVKMPQQKLTEDEINALLAFVDAEAAKKKK